MLGDMEPVLQSLAEAQFDVLWCLIVLLSVCSKVAYGICLLCNILIICFNSFIYFLVYSAWKHSTPFTFSWFQLFMLDCFRIVCWSPGVTLKFLALTDRCSRKVCAYAHVLMCICVHNSLNVSLPIISGSREREGDLVTDTWKCVFFFSSPWPLCCINQPEQLG